MRGKTHEHQHAAHEHHARKRGGRAKHHADGGEIAHGGGDPDVIAETKPGAHGGEKKRGGKVKHHGEEHKRKRGGKVHHEEHERKRGGHVAEGHHSKHRMDRPGRKKGGRVGADHAPLSSAHHESDHPGKQPKTQQGGLST